nr:MAG TPA: NlpC/P60 family [Caudoviricetes sp.]
MGVNSVAAAQARYWCQAGPGKPQGGAYSVGYSQPDRLMAYERSNEDGWLYADACMDCSSMVRGAINYGLHAAGYSWDDPRMLPGSSWTGSQREELTARGWVEVPWGDNDLYPSGGLQVGDVILSEAAAGGVGHVAMVVQDGLAEAWIAEDGSTDGVVGDQTGRETRVGGYEEHPYTTGAHWTHCLRLYEDGSSGGGGSTAAASYETSAIQRAVLAAADSVGCPWWAALACLWMETGEYGANVFGHDAGGAYSGGGEVTEEKFRDFYAQISAGATSNGVGPLQVTYPGYFFNDPDRAWWEPQASSEVACGILRDLIASEGDDYESLRRVGSRFNSGSAYGSYEEYGVRFSDYCRSWYNYGRPSGGGEDDLNMAGAVELLTEIRDSLRAGKEGSHYAGDMAWYSGAIRDELRALNQKVQVISDAVTPGIAGVKFDGELYNAVKEARKSLAAIEGKVAGGEPQA